MPYKIDLVQVPESPVSIIKFTISSKLTKEDYDLFLPELERLLDRREKVRMLITLLDFQGWTVGAMWEDTKYRISTIADKEQFERIAVVGDSKWEQGATMFAEPFTGGELRFFHKEEIETARQWIGEYDEHGTPSTHQ